MRPRKIDLNLLVTLEALVAEKSVSRTAQRLGLTQSAVSHSLRRLRAAFNDQLFVRSPTGVEPTRRALEIASATRLALEQLEQTIDGSAAFDPAIAERTFSLRLSEYVSSHLLRRLCPILRKVAPGVLKAMQDLQNHVNNSGLEKSLQELVKIRASQINACAFCLHMHTRDARAAGMTEERIYLLDAWR